MSGAVCARSSAPRSRAARQHAIEPSAHVGLQPLGLVAADEAEADGGREHAARGARTARRAASSSSGTPERAEAPRRTPAPSVARRSRARAPRASRSGRAGQTRAHGRGKRAALHAARAVGDGVREERVGERVELGEPRRVVGTRRSRAAATPWPACQSASRRRSARRSLGDAHLAGLPRGLEPARVRERRRSGTPSRRAAQSQPDRLDIAASSSRTEQVPLRERQHARRRRSAGPRRRRVTS